MGPPEQSLNDPFILLFPSIKGLPTIYLWIQYHSQRPTFFHISTKTSIQSHVAISSIQNQNGLHEIPQKRKTDLLTTTIPNTTTTALDEEFGPKQYVSL